jgi:hypothetical protein
MKTLNQLIKDYTCHLQSEDLSLAYKGILDFIGKLRSDFANKYPDYEIGSGIYQGYMDMSYFSLNTKELKAKGLKIAVVYLHGKGAFEIWLSARNRELIKKYRSHFGGRISMDIPLFQDAGNEDAVLEHTLTSSPDFDHPELMTERIERGTEQFVTLVAGLVN